MQGFFRIDWVCRRLFDIQVTVAGILICVESQNYKLLRNRVFGCVFIKLRSFPSITSSASSFHLEIRKFSNFYVSFFIVSVEVQLFARLSSCYSIFGKCYVISLTRSNISVFFSSPVLPRNFQSVYKELVTFFFCILSSRY